MTLSIFQGNKMSWRIRFPGTRRGLVAWPSVPKITPVLTSGGEAISAVFEASGLRELGDHFTNLRQLQLDDIFLGPMFRAKLGEGVAVEGNRFDDKLRVHQGILIFVQPDDSTPRLALPQVLTEEVIQAFNEQYWSFESLFHGKALFLFPKHAAPNRTLGEIL
jgi:hypothetical protein